MLKNKNTLFYGDNLTVLRNDIPPASVDLVYIDPPFNSQANYNILFKDEHGVASEAQIQAFKDTWQWDDDAERTYYYLVTETPVHVSQLITSLYGLLGRSQMMAYLVMMTVRLVELHRVLKLTGSLYVHCDPTASHYLKIILDTIFGLANFRNEIIWKRTGAHSDTKQGKVVHMGRVHDTILFYTKSDSARRQELYQPYSQNYIDTSYRHRDPDGRQYRLDNLTGPGGAAKGNPYYEVMGISRYWRYSKEKMDALIASGRVIQTNPGTVPAYKRYLDEMPGVPLQDLWDDIAPLGAQAAERLGYPTQKPLSLLERIIETSSNPGDVVLDAFAGCGTAIAAAQKLGRRWIGIDITHLAIALQKSRMLAMFPGIEIEVKGTPMDLAAARQLAREAPYQFQWWALTLVNAQPLGGDGKQGKKGADRGIDGVIPFFDGVTPKALRALVQVKGGHVRPTDLRDLRGTIEREQAPIGAFLSLEKSTQEMRVEAAAAGVYRSPGWQRDYPRLQILTIEELLYRNAEVKMPPAYAPFKQAQRMGAQADQGRLDF